MSEKPAILLCTAVRGGISPSYEASKDALYDWCHSENITIDKLRVAEAPIDAARDILAAGFLCAKQPGSEQPYTHCLMVDAGIGFEVDSIRKLLEADVDFAAAPAPLRRTRIDRALERGEARWANEFALRLTQEALETGKVRIEQKAGAPFVKADIIGGALLCLKRTVFERVAAGYPDIVASDEIGFFLPARFEKLGESGTIICREDVAFCRRWRALHSPEHPAEIYILCDATIIHEGHGYWQGCYGDTFG